MCVGERNRETLLRIPPVVALAATDAADQLHLEYRGADAESANPYLALGAHPPRGARRGPRGPAGAAGPRPRPGTSRGRGGGALRSGRTAGIAGGLPGGAGGGRDGAGVDDADAVRGAYVGIKRAELDAVADLDLSEVCGRYAAIY